MAGTGLGAGAPWTGFFCGENLGCGGNWSFGVLVIWDSDVGEGVLLWFLRDAGDIAGFESVGVDL